MGRRNLHEATAPKNPRTTPETDWRRDHDHTHTHARAHLGELGGMQLPRHEHAFERLERLERLHAEKLMDCSSCFLSLLVLPIDTFEVFVLYMYLMIRSMRKPANEIPASYTAMRCGGEMKRRCGDRYYGQNIQMYNTQNIEYSGVNKEHSYCTPTAGIGTTPGGTTATRQLYRRNRTRSKGRRTR